MGGLGYLEVEEDVFLQGTDRQIHSGGYEGRNAEVWQGWRSATRSSLLQIRKKRAAEYAGQLRTELGKRLDLIEKNAFRFCFVNDFPMYEYDERRRSLIFTHNPFSMPQGGLEALETMDPLEILAYQYDIVCNGVELSSGAVRNHRY